MKVIVFRGLAKLFLWAVYIESDLCVLNVSAALRESLWASCCPSYSAPIVLENYVNNRLEFIYAAIGKI